MSRQIGKVLRMMWRMRREKKVCLSPSIDKLSLQRPSRFLCRGYHSSYGQVLSSQLRSLSNEFIDTVKFNRCFSTTFHIYLALNIIQLFNGCGCNRPIYLSFGAGNDQVFYCMRPTASCNRTLGHSQHRRTNSLVYCIHTH